MASQSSPPFPTLKNKQDVGTFFMVDHMKRTHGVSPDDVRYFFVAIKAGLGRVFFNRVHG